MRIEREGRSAKERGEGGEMIEGNMSWLDHRRRKERGALELSLSSLFPSDENEKIMKEAVERGKRKGQLNLTRRSIT
jgi:hypothetical protein